MTLHSIVIIAPDHLWEDARALAADSGYDIGEGVGLVDVLMPADFAAHAPSHRGAHLWAAPGFARALLGRVFHVSSNLNRLTNHDHWLAALALHNLQPASPEDGA